MEKTLCRAFVSSTYIDLSNHRSHVVDTLRKSGIHVDPMEDWTADDREPGQFSRQRVSGCQLCILLVAFRRGHVPDGETLSITQMEYFHARKCGIAVLPFLLGDDEPWPRRFDELDKDRGVRDWREQLRREHGVGTFGYSPESIDVGPTVMRWLQESSGEESRQHVSQLLQSRSDRNLLYGILALQLDFINRDALIQGMHAWVLEKTLSLGNILLEQGALTEDEHAAIETLVRKHLTRHGQNVRESLGGAEPHAILAADLAKVSDPQVRASVVALRQAPVANLPAVRLTKGQGQTESTAVRYRILAPHRRGGLGEVFEAHDAELNRKVALKQIREEYADHADSRARFLLEAEITGRLEHPGIVPVYGLCAYPDGRPFYAMRFVQGESLSEAIQRFHAAETAIRDTGERALALRGLLNRFVAVCNAVAYAHSRGVLHRDLKPANIMLGPFGQTLVVDWGLARLSSPSSSDEGEELLRPVAIMDAKPTQWGSRVGTPEYMAPEQAAGRSDSLGPHTDIYGLGAVLFEILTGQPPHDWRGRAKDPPLPRSVQPTVPAALDAIVARAMNPDPLDRYPTATALAETVQCWLAEEPVASFRVVVAHLESLARSQPEALDYLEQLARNRVNLGLVLSGMARHPDAEATFRSAVVEYETLADSQPNAARFRADLATARLHLSQALTNLHRHEEAEQVRRAAVSDYDWLMATNPQDYRTNLASVMMTLMPRSPDQPKPTEGTMSSPPEASAILSAGDPAENADFTIDSGAPSNDESATAKEQPIGLQGRFTRGKLLGQGGAGSVWIARDNDLNREVAIKELHQNARPEARTRFLKEAQITSQLEHPNIVPIYGLGYRAQDETPFLIMRYVRGQTLHEAIRQYHASVANPQQFHRLLSAFANACHGVAFAHSRGVLHRDPKPANILLGDGGEVYVADWGLAKEIERDPAHDTPTAIGHTNPPSRVVFNSLTDSLLTHDGMIMGTPSYMAPEMAEGDTAHVDARTDVYVLGSGLFELLTGRRPYAGQTPVEILKQIGTTDPPKPSVLCPSLPLPLEVVCVRAMARLRDDRYPSASAMAHDIEQWLLAEAVASLPSRIPCPAAGDAKLDAMPSSPEPTHASPG